MAVVTNPNVTKPEIIIAENKGQIIGGLLNELREWYGRLGIEVPTSGCGGRLLTEDEMAALRRGGSTERRSG